ncbi:MAG TPA: TlpA disulfide reductase family protein [Polyangia bacterium]|nr:TlpA disulfide reductase family protein [Polyangia bacterium]
MTEREGRGPGWIGRALLGALLVIAAANFLVLARAPRHSRTRPAPGPAGREDGAAAPAFSGPLVGGGRAALADFRGKVVLLDFWATWCVPCVLEMPTLERVHKQFAGAGRPFSVLGINNDGDGMPREKIAAFVRKHGLSYPSIFDDGDIAAQYDVETIPHMVLIDRAGRVQKAFDGAVSEKQLVADIEELLK